MIYYNHNRKCYHSQNGIATSLYDCIDAIEKWHTIHNSRLLLNSDIVLQPARKFKA